MKNKKSSTEEVSHVGEAWRQSIDRPMKMDPKTLDPLTATRMTDHNVRGVALDDDRQHEVNVEELTKHWKVADKTDDKKDDENAA